MTKLIYPYRPLFLGGLRRPMTDGIVINTLNGREADFIGIFDTGADYVSLTPPILNDLGINPDDLPEERTETPSGIRLTKTCDYLVIAIEHSGRLYYPNGDMPAPVIFIDGGATNLLGQVGFLHNCSAAFNGPGRLMTLEF